MENKQAMILATQRLLRLCWVCPDDNGSAAYSAKVENLQNAVDDLEDIHGSFAGPPCPQNHDSAIGTPATSLADIANLGEDGHVSGHPLTAQETEVFHANLAPCSKAIAESQTFIKKFKAQQKQFRDGHVSQQYTQASPNVEIAMLQPSSFFALPPEIRNMIYQQVLLAGKPLNFHASGLLAADKGNRPDTAIMATCKQVLAEARPVFYSINSFFIKERAVLSRYLKATPQALRRLKLHAIKHVVLDGCDMLNITRIAELKRLRSLETLTVFERRFHRQLAYWDNQYHGIIFDAGYHHADTSDGDSANTQGEGMILSRVKDLVDNSCYEPTLKTMMFMRPSVKYKVIYQGGLEWDLRLPIGSRFLLTFIVSWDPEGQRYVFRCESMEKNGRYP